MVHTKPGNLKISLIQMEMRQDSDTNVQKALSLIGEAAKGGAKIICLPELFSTKYFPQEEKARESAIEIPGILTDLLSDTAKQNEVVLIAGSLYEKGRSGFFNTSVVFDSNGKMLGKYRKVHIPQDPSFYEQGYFSPGKEFKVFETAYGRVGVLICFDQWYPEAARLEKLLGADVIFYPTAIGWVKGIKPVEGDWHKAWESVQVGHAISNSVVVAAVNRVGREKDMSFWGGSFVCDQFGKVLVRADDKEGVVSAGVNFDLGRQTDEGWGFLRNRKPKTYRAILN